MRESRRPDLRLRCRSYIETVNATPKLSIEDSSCICAGLDIKGYAARRWQKRVAKTDNRYICRERLFAIIALSGLKHGRSPSGIRPVSRGRCGVVTWQREIRHTAMSARMVKLSIRRRTELTPEQSWSLWEWDRSLAASGRCLSRWVWPLEWTDL